MRFVVEFIHEEGGWIARIGDLVSLKSLTPIMALTNLVDEHEEVIRYLSQQPSPAHSADNAKMWAEIAEKAAHEAQEMKSKAAMYADQAAAHSVNTRYSQEQMEKVREWIVAFKEEFLTELALRREKK